MASVAETVMSDTAGLDIAKGTLIHYMEEVIRIQLLMLLLLFLSSYENMIPSALLTVALD